MFKMEIKKTTGKNEPEAREKWGSKVECVLSLIGMSVGLGNIWRFVILNNLFIAKIMDSLTLIFK